MTGEPTYTKVIRKSGRVEWNGKIEVTFPPDDSPFERIPMVLSTREGGWFAWTRRRLERKLDRAIRADRKSRAEPGEAIRVPAEAGH